jgi:hypothetical protein
MQCFNQINVMKNIDHSYKIGHKHSEKQKQKISEFMKNRDHSYKIGKRCSDECRQKISESIKRTLAVKKYAT